MFYAQESARYIPELEAKLSSNPRSPVFARLASYYLTEGKIGRAVELCQEGLKHFPDYATAHLVLGKLYDAQGRYVEAMLEYRKARNVVPDNPAVASMLLKVEQKEQEEFRIFTEDRARRLLDRRNTMTFEKYVADEPATGGATVDFLLERLRNARAATPPPRNPEEVQAEEDSRTEPPAAPRIVTATLAEIYASQGQYKEAIDAYKRLREQHPEDAERYERRIAQLSDLTKLQHAEQKE